MSVRYEIDPHNKLIAKHTGRKVGISRFRHVIEGRFKIGKASTLTYHIKTPSEVIAGELNLPHQLKLKGIWSLTKDYNLKLTLNKWRRQRIGDELTLKGEIIKIDAHSLLFAVTQRRKENSTSTHILKFEGSWQADKNNRLTFRIRKEKSNYDVLIFDGIWEVNRKHKIVYHYEKKLTRRGESKKRSLVFDGFWNIARKSALTYRLDLKGKSLPVRQAGGRQSAFDFRIGKGIVQGNSIKFEVGIGLSQRQKPVRKDVILYGKWKIKKGIGLIFEIRYAKGRARVMKFGAEAKLVSSSRIKFTLKNEIGKNLGLIFTLSKKMLKGSGESFIRFLRNRKEKAVYVGTGFIW